MDTDSHRTWERQIAAVWADETLGEQQVIAAIDALVAERPEGDARAAFEAAGARDSAGLEAEAEVLYRLALEAGLDDEHRQQAVIQLASTLRNLGRTDESIMLLSTQLADDPDGGYASATASFLSLALATAGQSDRAVAVALRALVPHLPRYHRSVRAYADELEAGSSR